MKLVLYVESNPDKKLADYHRIAQSLYSTDSCPSLKTIAEIIKKKDFIKKMAKEQLNKSSLKAAKFPELEKELINYINDMESRNTAIGTCSITTKANILIIDKAKP